jgi:hypothetical protein
MYPSNACFLFVASKYGAHFQSMVRAHVLKPKTLSRDILVGSTTTYRQLSRGSDFTFMVQVPGMLVPQ